METLRRKAVALIMLAVLSAACGPQGTAQPLATQGPTLAPLPSLDNTKWALTSLNGDSPVAGSAVTLDFYPGNYMQGNAGCNSYGVDYLADGDRFQVPEIHRTRDTCDAPDIMQQEAAFFGALTGIAACRATEERLEFDDAQDRTILAFARVHPPGTGSLLPGTRWVLASLQGQPLLPGTRVNLEFEEQSFGGFTGCNYYGGAYAATDEGALQIPSMEVTAIGCAEEIMAQEKAYVDAFMSTATYQLVDDRLELQDASGKTILVYARRAECAEEPADLAGTAWQLISVDGQEPVQGAATTLAFVDDKWFVEHSRCVAYISTYQTSGYDLRSGFSTWLGQVCQDEGDQGVVMIESPRDTCLVQGRLQISTVAGKVFVYEPLPGAAQPALEGPAWSLLSIVGERQIEGEAVAVPDPNTVLEGTAITLTLAGGMASGSAGCNTYQAAYSDGAALAFGPLAATEKACLTPEGVMAQEQRYLEALRAVTGYRIVGGQLWLWTGGGSPLVFAVSVPGTGPEAIP
jgi:heat shock protein HslJ